MKKKVLSVAVVVIAVVFALVGVYYSKDTETVKETQARTVEDILSDLDASINENVEENPMLGLSSNPYDYTKGNKYFDELVEKGVYGVPVMLNALKKSQYDGLTEYLIAIAVEEATGTELKETAYTWEDAKGFVTQFEKVSDNRVEIVKDILERNESKESLSKSLEPYGVIGMEALNQIEKDNTLSKKYREKLDKVDSYVTVSDKECTYMKGSFLK